MAQQIFRQQPQGLYDPRQEHDACGVGMVADLNGRASHDIVTKGITILWESDQITINISIQIRYGSIIPDVAQKVQEGIIANVEATSGLKVAEVNVRVGGVTFPKAED